MQKHIVIWLIMLFVLMGCTTVHPKRILLTTPSPDCAVKDGKGHAGVNCASEIVEVASNYKLHFVEFDDQGRTYADETAFGLAHTQIKSFLDDIRARTSIIENPNGVSVVVFVHGWKHSSLYRDSNLQTFRDVLAQLVEVEKASKCKREVIGLYVGWRGAGSHLGEPWETATFYSRKLAAEHVATGSFQRVLAGVKAIQAVTSDRTDQPTAGTPDCTSRLKTTYVGHSFGGLVVISSLTQDLQRGLLLDKERMLTDLRGRNPVRSPDEMVIAINPAIEGARFDSLYHAAASVKYTTYRSPRLVAITSTDDDATRIAFPLGRILNTATKQYPAGDASGRSAARKAVGHDPQFLTHKLSYRSKPVVPLPTALNSAECGAMPTSASIELRAQLDIERARAFYEAVGPDYDANVETNRTRTFCVSRYDGDKVFVLDTYPGKEINRNVPIWNVSTSSPVIDHHNDINNPRLLEFLRQLYVDSLFFR